MKTAFLVFKLTVFYVNYGKYRQFRELAQRDLLKELAADTQAPHLRLSRVTPTDSAFAGERTQLGPGRNETRLATAAASDRAWREPHGVVPETCRGRARRPS